MRRNSIKHFASEHCKKLKQFGIKTSKNFIAEDIHQFRLAYKKLHALLRMIAFTCSTVKQKKFSKSLIAIYHLAGAIRELQLQQLWARAVMKKDSGQLEAYCRFLQHDIAALKKEFAAHSIKKTIAHCTSRITATLPKNFSTKNGIVFIAHQKEMISQLVSQKNITDIDLHTIRKYLKDLHYTFSFTRLDKEPPYLNTLLENLGRFHDTCVALNMLQTAHRQVLQKNYPQLMQQLKSAGATEKNKIKKIILRQLARHFNK